MIKILLRFLYNQLFFISSELRKIKFRLLYSNIKIDGKTFIERGCKIVCVNGGKISIRNSSLGFNTFVFCDENGSISISDSFIGHNCTVVAKSKISIGPNCLIAEMVSVRDQNHLFLDKTKLIKDQGFSSSPVIIEENVWIGARSTILEGVTLRKHCVIAAGSVVTKDINSYTVVGGVPAKTIKVF